MKQKDLNIKRVKLSEIIPYENNPRFNDAGVEYVKKSIESNGYSNPISVDENMVIIAGHTRLKALQELGFEDVEVIIRDDLNPEQVKALRLADNKTSEFSRWDYEKLYDELQELSELEIDMTEFGFGEQLPDIDIDGIFEEHIDEYKGGDDTTYLTWGDKKVEVDDNDIEYLDNKYYEWESLKTGTSFVSWLGDSI